ncbi:hypothetical protein Val02_55870 [Virgisporangium aliadipatigenens]|uniref:Ricin B lectin domain-containing protein n=1 Tax=Virgisporangium aliadipatigenens TaxID=741659 RepID=A0A8J4DT08_9ACTN|nr:RICIN domain-containing protein [Virgisporangium aliadipatigenens]GIJ48701.1 hypothetical protein Val02_55870 [Virgisporangium aliadipatigenens]
MRRVLAFLVMSLFTVGVVAATPSPASADTLQGIYKLVNDRSDKCLDQSWTGGTEDKNVQAYVCSNPGTNQQWKWVTTGDGRIYFINVRSNKCLDQSYSGGTADREVIAYPCNGNANQYWRLVNLSGSTFSLQNTRSGQCLDQSWSGGTEDRAVIAYACDGSKLNQKWIALTV